MFHITPYFILIFRDNVFISYLSNRIWYERKFERQYEKKSYGGKIMVIRIISRLITYRVIHKRYYDCYICNTEIFFGWLPFPYNIFYWILTGGNLFAVLSVYHYFLELIFVVDFFQANLLPILFFENSDTQNSKKILS